MSRTEWCLKYKVEKKCSTTKARAAVFETSRGKVHTPVFMPVGTQGTMKGITVDQMKNMGMKWVEIHFKFVVTHFGFCERANSSSRQMLTEKIY